MPRLASPSVRSRALLAAAVAAFTLAAFAPGISPGHAQSGDVRPADPKPTTSDPAKDGQRKIDEFVEASQTLNGPAGNPECVWLGRRVVGLMWRDDLDTAFRHLDLYDRFGCPGGHIQATFRCLVKFGPIDPKVPEALSTRVHACWINTSAQPPAPPVAAQPVAPPAPAK